MLDGEGWPREQRVAFERELEGVVDGIKHERGTPRWHVSCEYDPRELRPPKPGGEWAESVRNALRRPGAGGEIQLVPDASRVGRGVVVKYLPTGNNGSFSGVSEDKGISVAETASTRIAACVRQKAQKVREGTRAQNYSRWWLLLEDEVVIVHDALGEEWSVVKNNIRCWRRDRPLEQGGAVKQGLGRVHGCLRATGRPTFGKPMSLVYLRYALWFGRLVSYQAFIKARRNDVRTFDAFECSLVEAGHRLRAGQ